MLEVELDIFSGMPNPTWILSETEEKELLDIITSEPTQISPVYTPEEVIGLGYGGLIVRELKTDEGIWNRTNRAMKTPFPTEFRIGSKPAKHASAAEWLFKTSEKKGSQVREELREMAARGVNLVSSPPEVVDPATYTSIEGSEVTRAPIRWGICHSNYFVANVDVFNQPQYVRHNNCYAFAANHLGSALRKAHPGLRGGRPARFNTCDEVIAGLRADGWNSGSCWINAHNVIIIACVVMPGPPGASDFHFYRCVYGQPQWWWGHKRGATPARYTDECGRNIAHYRDLNLDPTNICREGYTDFCGFFYQNNSSALVQGYPE